MNNLRFDFTPQPPANPAPVDPVVPEVNQDPPAPAPEDPATPPVDPVDPPAVDPPVDPVADPNNPQDPAPQDPPQDPPGLFTDLNTHLGMDISGEFEDSTEGMVNYIKAASETMSAGALGAIFEAFPDVKDFLDYRQNGGTANKFFSAVHPETDYSAIEITTEDVGTQREVVRTLMRMQKHDEAYINETLSDYANANILEKHAKHAKTALTQIQKDEAVAETARVANEAADQRQQAADNWSNIQGIVKTGSVGNVLIPEAEKVGFLDWMSKPVDKDGNTRRDLDRSELPQDQALLLEYMIYKKADVSKLVVNRKKTKAAQSISQRLGNNGVTSRMDSNTTPSRTKPAKLPELNNFF